jgi:hypothetical protein
MDELDRMFRRLVQNIRNGYPVYLTQPFEVGELFQNLIPYRHNRRELDLDTNEDYEIALCRMLAGEQNLLGGDDVMRETIREELASPNPNTAIYREFASSKVALVADAVRRLDARSPVASTPVARASGAVPPAPRPAAAPAPTAPPAPPAPTVRSAAPARAQAMPSPPPRPSGKMSPSSSPGAIPPAGICRFCGGSLPGGRRVVFCPSCGQNLAVQRCPACGSELDLNWKFCVTCGRGTGAT